MKKSRAALVGTILVSLSMGFSAEAQRPESKGRVLVRTSSATSATPESGPVGNSGLPGQPAQFVAAPASVNLFQSDTNADGTYRFREMNATTTPVPYQVTPFTQTFRTTEATTFVQVTYSSQVWIDTDTTSTDAVGIECYLKQTDPATAVVTTTGCWGAPTGQWPTILGGANLINGLAAWTSWASYVSAKPNQDSELVINISTYRTRARIANAQLHLAF